MCNATALLKQELHHASPTVTTTMPVPPQFGHIAWSALLPLPLHSGQVFSAVWNAPGAASSPGLRCAASVFVGTGEGFIAMLLLN
jgi:hypothetical protein